MSGRELRAAEGRRVQGLYRDAADNRGLVWPGRTYDWDRSEHVNKAITTAYQALYGAAAAVIQALGASPALGFIHVGTVSAFVYDIADLHKTDLGVRVALDAVADDDGLSIERSVRTAMNVAMSQERTLSQMVDAILRLFSLDALPEGELNSDDLSLIGDVPANMNYSEVPTSPDWGF